METFFEIDDCMLITKQDVLDLSEIVRITHGQYDILFYYKGVDEPRSFYCGKDLDAAFLKISKEYIKVKKEMHKSQLKR